jgi:hypothetical protein
MISFPTGTALTVEVMVLIFVKIVKEKVMDAWKSIRFQNGSMKCRDRTRVSRWKYFGSLREDATAILSKWYSEIF